MLHLMSLFRAISLKSPRKEWREERLARQVSSEETGKVLELGKEEVRALERSWATVSSRPDTGLLIFFLILTERPNLRVHFHLTKTDSPTQLLNEPALAAHAALFLRFLDRIVSTLCKKPRKGEEQDSLVKMIRNVGIQHCRIQGLSFTAENWLSFKNAILEVVTQGEEESKYFAVWNKVTSFVISEMKDAYLNGVRRNTWPCLPPQGRKWRRPTEVGQLDMEELEEDTRDPVFQ